MNSVPCLAAMRALVNHRASTCRRRLADDQGTDDGTRGNTIRRCDSGMQEDHFFLYSMQVVND
jgi:hypothetical protein